jgi:hypothetical protein
VSNTALGQALCWPFPVTRHNPRHGGKMTCKSEKEKSKKTRISNQIIFCAVSPPSHFHFHSLLRPRSGQLRSCSSSTWATSTTAPHIPCHKLGPPFSVVMVGGAMVRRYTLRIRDRLCIFLVCSSGCLRLPMAVVTQRSAPKQCPLSGERFKSEADNSRGQISSEIHWFRTR